MTPMPASLTPRQRAIYEWLLVRQNCGQPPAGLEDICTALGLKSRGSLHKHIQALVRAGLVEPLAGKRRGVRLAPAQASIGDQLPLLGYVAAGHPIEALPVPEPLEVPQWLRSSGACYVLEVRGDSMIEAGIFDGDRVVIEQRDSARDGQLVVALLQGEAATLKRIEQTPTWCILHPANATHAPQRYRPDEVCIQGVLIAVMRRY